MSSLRLLALSYLAAASVFTLTGVVQSYPEVWRDLDARVRGMPDRFARQVWNPALDRLRNHDVALLDSLDHQYDPVVRLTIRPLVPGEERLLTSKPSAPVEPRALAPAEAFHADNEFGPSATIEILPDLPDDLPEPSEPRMISPRTPRAVAPDIRIARSAERPAASPGWRIPDPPLPDPPLPDAPAGPRAIAASVRLKAALSPDLLNNFDLFLYVSKASSGPLAQRMYVFKKRPGGALNLAYDWAASTGREKHETNARGRASFTATPAGYYQLDPKRMYRRYRSYSWDQPMPNAMFFNWERQGLQTGLAIHAAEGENISKLGQQRNSAGCIHLSPENAEILQTLIRANYRGQTPRFAYNRTTRTMSNKGALMYDREGNLRTADGYRVLIFIEDYGGKDMVAALF